MNCPSCREVNETSEVYCRNCGNKLSEAPFSSTPPSEFGTRPDDINYNKQLISWMVDVIYIVLSLIMIYQIYLTISTQNLQLISFLNQRSEADLPVLIYLTLLYALAIIRGWANLHIDPPDPFPEGFKTLNTIVGIIVLPIFLVLFPYIILGVELASLVCIILLIWGYIAPSRERKKAREPASVRTEKVLEKYRKLPEFKRRQLQENLGTSPKMRQQMEKRGIDLDLLEEGLAIEEIESTERHLDTIQVQKSGIVNVNYSIKSKNDSLMGTRTGFNRTLIYLLVVAVSIPTIIPLTIIPTRITGGSYWDITPVEYFTSLSLFNFPWGIIVLIISIFFWFPRKYSIIDSSGREIGQIKGNLIFTRWYIDCYPNNKDFNLRFKFISLNMYRYPKECGTIESDKGVFRVVKVSFSEICVYDAEDTEVLIITSQESKYVRKNFRISSSNTFEFFDSSTIAMCIIERFYRPQSESSN